MKNYLITALFLFCGSIIFAQDFTISGYMQDATSGEELLYATVSVEGTTNGVSTNLYGFYSLTLPAGEYTINYSYVGYKSIAFKLNLNQFNYTHMYI